MPTLFNVSPFPLAPHVGELCVESGAPYDFTDEEAASIGVDWSTVNPRAGIADEATFKLQRDLSVLSKAQLEAKAAEHDIDVSGAKTNPARVAVIVAALTAPAVPDAVVTDEPDTAPDPAGEDAPTEDAAPAATE